MANQDKTREQVLREVSELGRRVAELERSETERERTDEALRESEQRFRATFEKSGAGMVMTDMEANFLEVNPAFCEFLGYGRDDLLKMKVMDVTSPEDLNETRAQFGQIASKTRQGVDLEKRYIRKDGTTVWGHITSASIFDSESRPIYSVAVIQNITRRKRAEEALRESEEKFKAAFESSHDAITITSKEGKVFDCNQRALELFGLAGKDGFSEKRPADFSPRFQSDGRDSREASREHIEQALAGEGSTRFEWLHQRSNGETFPAEIILTAYELGGETVLQATIRDITERKQGEEALRRSEEQAKRLARENAILAEIGRIISSTLNIGEVYEPFSEKVKELIAFDRIVINLFHWKDGTISFSYVDGVPTPGRQPGDRIPLQGTATEKIVQARKGIITSMVDEQELATHVPGLLPEFRAGIRSALTVPLLWRDKVIGGLALRSIKPDAYTVHDLELAESIANQIAGAIANAQLFAVHQNSEKEMLTLEEQLHQAQKMEAIGTLAGGIAHDFNNILSAILGYAELASLDLEEGSRARINLEQSIKAGHRARDLVQQILAFSRQGEQERKMLNVRPIVKEGLKFLRASLPATIEIHQEIEEDLGPIKANPTQIHQILMNLCTNAAHAMDEKGGALKVSLCNLDLDGRNSAAASGGIEPGPYVQLRVGDTGHGMSPEILRRIFDPYFTTKGPGKGTGLGLAVVHGIVKAYGGGITVSSEVGKGSTFDIYFPRIETAAAPPEVYKVDPLPLGGRERVLFVDDEKAIVEIGREILEHLGYDVATRTSSIDALELFRAGPGRFDLVVTDMTMPNMTGDKLAQELLKIRSDIPIILCTGFSEHITEERAKGIGIREFVMKPMVMKDLAKAMRRALQSPRKSRERTRSR